MTLADPAAKSIALEMIDVTITALESPNRIVLENVNWSVATGDYWVIGGLHGSGKSDFVSLAASIMPAQRGIYRVFGQELRAGFEYEGLSARRRVGLVFDGGRMLNHLTIAENVALALRYHQNLTLAEASAPVEALLQLTELTARATAFPGDVSRNWQQRAGLARALALKPEVLLLDNPLTGLDPRDAIWWLDCLDQIAAGHPIVDGRPMTIVATADDLRPWKNRARQFAVLKNKKLIVLGNRSELAREETASFQELLGIEPAKT